MDVDPRYYTMDPNELESKITKRTKAILPVHLYGQAADMDPILEIARQHKLVVIEDAAQAHGAEYKARRAGSLGDMGCFSFYPGKNLGAYGEGGARNHQRCWLCENASHAARLGGGKRYQHVLKGYNYRMEGIQGAVLRVKLRRLEAWTEARRAAAARYDELLAESGVPTPKAMPYSRHVYHLYAIRTQSTGKLGRLSLVGKAFRPGSTIRFQCTYCPPSLILAIEAEISRMLSRQRTKFCRCQCILN